MCTILKQTWSRLEFRVNKLSSRTLQFFFTTRAGLESIIDIAPWNIENQLLILVEELPNVIPSGHAFEWIECWVHVRILSNYKVLEAIGHALTKSTHNKFVHNHEVNLNGFRFYRMHLKINIKLPLKKCLIFNIG